jgi:hypothetical protein
MIKTMLVLHCLFWLYRRTTTPTLLAGFARRLCSSLQEEADGTHLCGLEGGTGCCIHWRFPEECQANTFNASNRGM